MCNRPLFTALVFIAGMPVGPVCARRAGLVELARKKSGALRLGRGHVPAARREDSQTLDLFAEVSNA
ncbi:hypothetical protein [Diaphorobacter sp. ED-3]|uniref:hypothetical protein n=1 Tax=Diaphorobacter sp. ED-3 TaxID=3016636 RepID=UPI0022DD19D0|nr:hypothetical protein [Diaphorobacter sp. ED-3]